MVGNRLIIVVVPYPFVLELIFLIVFYQTIDQHNFLNIVIILQN